MNTVQQTVALQTNLIQNDCIKHQCLYTRLMWVEGLFEMAVASYVII